MQIDNACSVRKAITYLHVLQAVLCSNDSEHVLFAALLHFSGDQQLVEDEVGLLEVEDDVQFADVAVVLVHLLDIAVDDFEGDQLVVGVVGGGDEEERGIATVDDFGVCERGGQQESRQQLVQVKLRNISMSWYGSQAGGGPLQGIGYLCTRGSCTCACGGRGLAGRHP